MVKLDVKKPETEPTPAVSTMVVVRQKGKIWICIDPSDVNKNILRRHFPLTTIEEISADIKGSKFFALLDSTKVLWQIKEPERTKKYQHLPLHGEDIRLRDFPLKYHQRQK